MLPELKQQIEDIVGGSTREVPTEYGHALNTILQQGAIEAWSGNSEEAQIQAMKDFAEDQILLFGPNILDFLRPELRELITPENLDELVNAYNKRSSSTQIIT